MGKPQEDTDIPTMTPLDVTPSAEPIDLDNSGSSFANPTSSSHGDLQARIKDLGGSRLSPGATHVDSVQETVAPPPGPPTSSVGGKHSAPTHPEKKHKSTTSSANQNPIAPSNESSNSRSALNSGSSSSETDPSRIDRHHRKKRGSYKYS